MIDLALSLEKEGLFEEAGKIYSEVLATNPSNFNVIQHLVQLYIQQERLEEALALLKTIPVQGMEGREIRRKMGLIYLELERYDEAIQEFSYLLSQDPKSDDIRLYLATAYGEKKDYDRAISEYSLIPGNSPVYFEARGQIAFLHKEKGQPEKAISIMKEAIAEQPDRPELHLYLSGIYESLDRNAEALKILTDVERKFSANTAIQFRIAVLFDKTGDRDASIARLKKVIAMAPNDAQALNYLGYTYAEMGIHLNEALGYLKKAVALRPRDGYILDSLGWVYFKMKRYDEAIVHLEKAVRLSEDDVTILEHLAEAYMAKKDFRRALSTLRKAHKLDPDNSQIAEKIRKLRTEKGLK